MAGVDAMLRFPSYKMHDFPKRWASHARYRMSASTLEPLTLDEILSSVSGKQLSEWEKLPLGYAADRGGLALREVIANDYPGLSADNIVVFAGAQEAAFCALYALLGDQGLAINDSTQSALVAAIEPEFEPLIALPKALGANVITSPLRPTTSGWVFSEDQFCEILNSPAALAILNFPNNPTGALISQQQQAKIIERLKSTNAWLYSDEVFRGLEYDPGNCLAPAAELYERAVSLGSIAKPYGLGGVRVGWLACQDQQFIDRVVEIKQSLSICTGTPDEWLATVVLQQKDHWLEKNRAYMADHLRFITNTLADLKSNLEWLPPQAGIIAYPQLLGVNSSEKFAEKLVQETGVMVFPSSSFIGDFAPHFRLGFGLADFKKSWQLFCDFLQVQ
ncbi:aminotransferase class I/II-fold pyridoxal phosphate-dependent enzyme [Aurantivibrio plasticivorans]